jgi:rhodanese-related sulfurtransferase
MTMLCLFRRKNDSTLAHDLVAQGALLLDVRSREEFAAGHLPGSVNIPVDELEGRLHELPPSDRPVVAYCRSGMRSGRAKSLLERHGFTQVVNLGPMSAW